jgi:hypothetical protein
MILARGALRPQRGWRFPAGSQIGPRQYLIVWVDEDGTEGAADDPTDPATEAYHTSFRLDADRDELFLFDRDQAGNQVIDGVRWGTSTIEPYYGRLDGDPDHDPTQPVVPPFMPPPASGTADPLPADHSLARLPDGRRTSPFVLRAAADATPAQSNAPPGGFRRGDANLTGFLEMADAISVLGYLFLGQGERPCLDALDADDSGDVAIADATAILGYLLLGATAPPPPGPDACGPDGTPDDPLPACDYSACGSP